MSSDSLLMTVSPHPISVWDYINSDYIKKEKRSLINLWLNLKSYLVKISYITNKKLMSLILSILR